MKTLMDEYNASCTLLEKTRKKDGLGGYTTTWTPGLTFDAAWEFQSAPEITVAEQQGVARTYRIYVDKTLNLDYHEVFRREDTKEVYRVTNPGTDRKTPTGSLLGKRLIEVEKWEIPPEDETEE